MSTPTSTAPSSASGGVSYYNPTTGSNAAGNAIPNGGTLTQSDFLNLLSTQLENQDPTNPESNTDFAAQMAQFSSLSEMNSLTSTMTDFAGVSQLASGSSLIGQNVTSSATDANGNAISGTVTGAAVANNELYLTVAGYEVPYSDVTSISAATPTTTTTTTATTSPAAAAAPNAAAAVRHLAAHPVR